MRPLPGKELNLGHLAVQKRQRLRFPRAVVEDVRTFWTTDNEAMRDMIAKIRKLNELTGSTETKLAA